MQRIDYIFLYNRINNFDLKSGLNLIVLPKSFPMVMRQK